MSEEGIYSKAAQWQLSGFDRVSWQRKELKEYKGLKTSGEIHFLICVIILTKEIWYLTSILCKISFSAWLLTSFQVSR